MSRPWALLSFFPLLSLACATRPDNPSFPLTVSSADSVLKEMKDHPKPLARPLVIVGGYLDMGFGPMIVRGKMRSATGDERIATVCLFSCGDFDDCRAKVIAAVDRAFPCSDPAGTTPVDVIGISMGGLAARYAAAPPPPSTRPGDAGYGRRLRIARLFTVSSPHQGATLANLPTFHKLALQMRQGSDFLTGLNAGPAAPTYTIVPYVRLDDGWVGESNAAPKGRVAWWVPNRPLEDSHVGAASDPRILADIARRLRGEEPFTRDPPMPLPEGT